MAATSKKLEDVLIWVKKVILSCETPSQIVSAEKLVGNLYRCYNYVPQVKIFSLRHLIDVKLMYIKEQSVKQ